MNRCDECKNKDSCVCVPYGCECFEIDLEKHDAKVRAEVLRKVKSAMYHQCFKCDNDEKMQKWDGGNWFRYKLFENVIDQMKEQKNEWWKL